MTKRTVQVAKGLSKKEGVKKVIAKAMKLYGGDYRGAVYDPLTGKGGVV
jgi:hypothetical protein